MCGRVKQLEKPEHFSLRRPRALLRTRKRRKVIGRTMTRKSTTMTVPRNLSHRNGKQTPHELTNHTTGGVESTVPPSLER